MSDEPLIWALIEPLVVGLLVALLWLARTRAAGDRRRYLDVATLAVACAGLLAEGALLMLAEGEVTLDRFGITLGISSPARIVLLAVNAALLCVPFVSWADDLHADEEHRGWVMVSALATSSLLAGGLLVGDSVASALILLLAALIVFVPVLGLAGAGVASSPQGYWDGLDRMRRAVLISGSIKHLAIATLGTGLLVSGALLLARYALNMENRSLLQLGVGMVAVGALVRAGAMPFSAANGDLLEATPSFSIIILGATTPAVLVAGLLMLMPVEGTLVHSVRMGMNLAGVGAIAALLAGLRALGVMGQARQIDSGDNSELEGRKLNLLVATSIAAQTAWALCGVLSGSKAGAAGALLLAVNIALAVPLLVVSSSALAYGGRWPRFGVVVGAAAMLGLPPLGGFAGTLLIAQAALGSGGLVLAMLMVGSALVAAGWLGGGIAELGSGGEERSRGFFAEPRGLLVLVLAFAQVALFLASGQIAGAMDDWVDVPWLSAP